MARTAEDIIARVELDISARSTVDGTCQALLVTKIQRCGGKAKVRCPICELTLCKRCADVTVCCAVPMSARSDVEWIR